jgi:type II secretory pathway component GspD/PulD (secretin)
VGWLFKSKKNDDKKSERLFMITPTIVPYDSSNIPDNMPKGVIPYNTKPDKSNDS